ncbi:MAG TPA: DUF1588 domain-containing protein [Polyangiaceae bacterium]|nr:DUF1588 domain-containing protein [Polyangiaceae bacterium]
MSPLRARLVGLLALGTAACTSHIPGVPMDMSGSGGSGGSTPMSGAGGMSTSGMGSGGSLSCSSVSPGAAPIRLLTHVQYDNTVADLLGDTTQPSLQFPAENEVVGYRNNVAANQANPRLVEAYQTAAESLAATAVATRLATLAPCDAGADNATCGHTFITNFGAQVFRRPLATDENASFVKLFDATLPDGYSKAVELTLRAMLQSPQFLYRVDALHAATPETGAIALGGNEMASRLAYFLTNTTPDAALLQAATQNQLSTDSELEAQARRLLETPRARAMAQDFVAQWLGLSGLDGAARAASDVSFGATELVPDWKTTLGQFLNEEIWNDGDMKSLLTSPKLFMTDKLRTLYAPGTDGTPSVPYLADTQRAGLLTQPAIMALLAHSDQSGPVQRGVFVLEKLLCQAVEPPPPTVVAVPPMVDQTATTRERFAQHTKDPNCAGCHVTLDGIGFGFEKYDQFGRYRDTENTLPIDDSGEVLTGIDDTVDGPFKGAIELSRRLSTNATVRDCIATQWYRYAMGRVEDSSDQCSLGQVKTRFATGNGAFRELLVGIVLSDAFRYRPAVVGP